MSDDARMTKRSRVAVCALAVALLAAGCGDSGQSETEREAAVEMLERLGRSPDVATCMIEEFDGKYEAADFQPLIDGRGDYGNVDFELLEDMVVAERDCTEDE